MAEAGERQGRGRAEQRQGRGQGEDTAEHYKGRAGQGRGKDRNTAVARQKSRARQGRTGQEQGREGQQQGRDRAWQEHWAETRQGQGQEHGSGRPGEGQGNDMT